MKTMRNFTVYGVRFKTADDWKGLWVQPEKFRVLLAEDPEVPGFGCTATPDKVQGERLVRQGAREYLPYLVK